MTKKFLFNVVIAVLSEFRHYFLIDFLIPHHSFKKNQLKSWVNVNASCCTVSSVLPGKYLLHILKQVVALHFLSLVSYGESDSMPHTVSLLLAVIFLFSVVSIQDHFEVYYLHFLCLTHSLLVYFVDNFFICIVEINSSIIASYAFRRFHFWETTKTDFLLVFWVLLEKQCQKRMLNNTLFEMSFQSLLIPTVWSICHFPIRYGTLSKLRNSSNIFIFNVGLIGSNKNGAIIDIFHFISF